MSSESLNLSDFYYELPDEKIARFPLENRSDSKLLFYHQGQIDHRIFHQIPDLLPDGCLLVFNDTKVIPARLIMHKDTGARIEIFLLDPVGPSNNYDQVMAATTGCTWHVMIGNAKKWKAGQPLALQAGAITLTANRTADDEVSFTWNTPDSFSDVLTRLGEIPLPPYLGRSASEADKPRYQTVYSKSEGAVAAPTAGLHFTHEILAQLPDKNIRTDYVTLHVSAGTFQPIKAEKVTEHPMHREQVIIRRSNLINLLKNDTVIPVGTTSMRTLESLFWYGQELSVNPESPFFITQNTPYRHTAVISKKESLEQLLACMDRSGTDTLIGHTEIYIYPGYTFRICSGLVTNFHLPGSTLILLIAALVDEDWRTIYDEALKTDYRFLSYGDSSLILP